VAHPVHWYARSAVLGGYAQNIVCVCFKYPYDSQTTIFLQLAHDLYSYKFL